MKLMRSTAKILNMTREDAVRQMKEIEYAGRNCYASQDRITEDSYISFIHRIISNDHMAPIEFGYMRAEIVTSRAVLAELSRHRLVSMCVESQRYIDEYSKEDGGITFIKPWWVLDDDDSDRVKTWYASTAKSEEDYNSLRAYGCIPQEARSVLTNDTACKIIIGANFREWMHIFKLRCDNAAYPEMRNVMRMLQKEAHDLMPEIF